MARIALFFVFIFSIFFSSCNHDSGGVSTQINSIGILSNDNSQGSSRSVAFNTDIMPTDFSMTPNWSPHYISANAPDYLKITITEVNIVYDEDDYYGIWSGEEELTIDGPSVDMSHINDNLGSFLPGYIKEVQVVFKSKAKIKGSVTDNFILDYTDPSTGSTETYYTKSGYYYDAYTNIGGADSDSVYMSGPAEEQYISLAADPDGELRITIPIEKSFGEEDFPTLNLLFDLNMVLRFYNGRYSDSQNGQPNPTDPIDKAFFFAHSISVDNQSFIVGFFGEVGTIEGYKTYVVDYDVGNPENNSAGTGWVSLVFDTDDNFVSGQIYGDDDNSISAGKGIITNYELVGNTASFSGNLFNRTIYGFERLNTIGSLTPRMQSDSNVEGHSGETIFRLLLKE